MLPVVVFELREYPTAGQVRGPGGGGAGGAAAGPGPAGGPYHTSAKTGAYRAQFHRQCVEDLRAGLHTLCNGAPLLVAYGNPDAVLGAVAASLSSAFETVQVVCAAAPCWEEQQADAAVERACDSPLIRVHEGTLYHPADILAATGLRMPGALPDVFTPWRSTVEKAKTRIRRASGPAEFAQPLLSQQYLDTAASAAKKAAVEEGAAGLDYVPALAELLGLVAPRPPLDTVRETAGDEIPVEDAGSDAAAGATEKAHAMANADPRGDYFMPVGGESAGLARVQQYIWDEDRLRVYFETRNGLVGQSYSTKFAPWLAKGCISPRFVSDECRRYEQERGVSNKSTYWVKFELMVRDYFILYAAKCGRRLFWEYGAKAKQPRVPWRSPWKAAGSEDAAAAAQDLLAWKTGQTGHPLVDACMRELAATGFMSNRGRQNVASYLVHELNLDWRLGAAHFEELLVDYTPEANWGNWHAAAGLNGGRLNRFNVVKQGWDYDPSGIHVRLWCPELAKVPPKKIHEPWLMTKDEQQRASCAIGQDYPSPIEGPVRRGKGRRAQNYSTAPSKRGQRGKKHAGDIRKVFEAQAKRKQQRKKAGRGRRVQGAWATGE